jgi:hypothetical protein
MVQNFCNFQACIITLMLKRVVKHFQECKQGLHLLIFNHGFALGK